MVGNVVGFAEPANHEAMLWQVAVVVGLCVGFSAPFGEARRRGEEAGCDRFGDCVVGCQLFWAPLSVAPLTLCGLLLVGAGPLVGLA